jgi:hypothetical protein
MTAPERSLEQRRTAIREANRIRTYRARLKKDLQAGRRSIDSLLLRPPDEILTAKVMELLLAVPKYGRVKVNKVLVHTRTSPSKTIGGLSERQRMDIVRLIRDMDAERYAGVAKREAASRRAGHGRRRIAA